MEAGNEYTEGWRVTLLPLPPVYTASHHGGREQGYRGVESDPACLLTWRQKAEVTLSTRGAEAHAYWLQSLGNFPC